MENLVIVVFAVTAVSTHIETLPIFNMRLPKRFDVTFRRVRIHVIKERVIRVVVFQFMDTIFVLRPFEFKGVEIHKAMPTPIKQPIIGDEVVHEVACNTDSFKLIALIFRHHRHGG